MNEQCKVRNLYAKVNYLISNIRVWRICNCTTEHLGSTWDRSDLHRSSDAWRSTVKRCGLASDPGGRRSRMFASSDLGLGIEIALALSKPSEEFGMKKISTTRWGIIGISKLGN